MFYVYLTVDATLDVGVSSSEYYASLLLDQFIQMKTQKYVIDGC